MFPVTWNEPGTWIVYPVRVAFCARTRIVAGLTVAGSIAVENVISTILFWKTPPVSPTLTSTTLKPPLLAALAVAFWEGMNAAAATTATVAPTTVRLQALDMRISPAPSRSRCERVRSDGPPATGDFHG